MSKGLGVVMKRCYIVWCTLSAPILLLAGQHEAILKQPLSLKKIALQKIVHHLTEFSAEQLRKLPADIIIEDILQKPDVVAYLPYLTIPTLESRSIGHPVLRTKIAPIYTFENGNYIILRDLDDRRWLPDNYDNHKHFFIQIKAEDNTTVASLGQHNLSPITCLCIHPQKTTCAIGRENGSISLFNLQDYTQQAEFPLLNTAVQAMIYAGYQLIAFNEYNETYTVDTKALYKRAWLPNIHFISIWPRDTLNIRQNFHIIWLQQLMPRINAPYLMHYFFDQHFTRDKLYLLLHYAAIKKAISILQKSNHLSFVQPLIDNFAILLRNNEISPTVIDDLTSQLQNDIMRRNKKPLYKILRKT